MIYLDNCATTKPRAEVIEVLNNSLIDNFGNSSSLHKMGLKSEEAIENSRDIISNSLGVDSKEIYFNSGGTEGNNTFLRGIKFSGSKNKVITTKLEHSSVMEVFKELKNRGLEVVYLENNEDGTVDLEDLKKNIDKNTALVSIMHVNNEIGYINDIKKCAQIIHENSDALFHSDGVQAFGKIPVNLRELGVDSYTISAHKIHGLKGNGAIFIKNGINVSPLILGGGQERKFRSGTTDINGIVAFSKAAEIMTKNFEKEYEHKKLLKDKVIDYCLENISDIVINTPEYSPASILNISFKGTRGEVILHYLEQDDIFISTASACSSNSKTKNILEKMGRDINTSEGSIRICFSYENTEEEIDIFLEKLKYAVEDIRKVTKGRI